jgi:hypothetical protein
MGDGGGLYLLGYNGENGEVSGNYVNGGPRLGCLIYFDMGTTGFRVVDNVAENGSMRGFNISGGSNMVMQRNYTDVQGWHSVCDPCDIERPFLYEPGDQPPAALDIMANAGLEPSYRDLLDADGEPILAVNKRLPEGKKTVPFFLIPYRGTIGFTNCSNGKGPCMVFDAQGRRQDETGLDKIKFQVLNKHLR